MPRRAIFRSLAFGILLVNHGLAASVDLSVMSFNVWSAEDSAAGRQRIIDTVKQSGAEIVGFQEMGSGALRNIATSMGYYSFDQGLGSEAILSRYRIIAMAPQKYGALVELAPGHEAWIFNTHLYHAPYGPYQLNGIAYNSGRIYDPAVADNIGFVISDQVRARGAELKALLKSVNDSGSLADGSPVFVTGDFNEPSHLDWTAVAATAGVHIAEVPWPTSMDIMNQGFQDSWREIYPNEVAHAGRTWSPVYPSSYMNRGDNVRQQPRPILEPQDRIDLVYYAGEQVAPMISRRSGPIGGDVSEEWEIANYPSDHNAVTTTFRVDGIDGTRLTFRTLGANGDTLPSDYGSRSLGSPNVAVSFSVGQPTPGAAQWKFRQDSLWPNGATYLEFGAGASVDGTTAFSVSLALDESFGVKVESFSLLDYPDDNVAGHAVRWELWQGASKLDAGLTTVPDDGQSDIIPQLQEFTSGLVELRVIPLEGADGELGFDNLTFHQIAVPEPSPLVMMIGTWLLCQLRMLRTIRRRHSSHG